MAKRKIEPDSGDAKLYALVFDTIEEMRDRNSIKPAWVAEGIVSKLDPQHDAHILLRHGCNLQVRQYARMILAKKFGTDTTAPEDEGSPQLDAYPDLQRYYPMAHLSKTHEPTYVKLEKMNENDVYYNVNRMRRIGHGQLRGADALAAWWQTVGSKAA